MMKITKASLGIFIVAFLVLAITNIIILAGVSLNRSGEPTSHTILTQRELQPLRLYLSQDNDGVFLQFVYRVHKDDNSTFYTHMPDWLNEQKLKALNFDIEEQRHPNFLKTILSKEVFMVLENDGDAYQKSLKRAEERVIQEERLYNEDINNESRRLGYERAKRVLLNEQLSASRLFAIDAGLSYEKLRQKYDNIKKYIIVKGVIRPFYLEYGDRFYGIIKKSSIQKIHIPLKHSKLLRELSDKRKKQKSIYGYIKLNKNPEYQVELKYGKRYEPWVVSVDKIE